MKPERDVGAYLVYSIVRGEMEEFQLPVAGVDGQRIQLIRESDLAATVSWMPQPHWSGCRTEIPPLLNFFRVIQEICRHSVTLPMQYGCFLETADVVTHMLRSNHGNYRKALDRLEGKLEFSIRLLMSRRQVDKGPGTASRGVSYLAYRRSCYADQDRQAREENEAVEQCRSAFHGLYDDWMWNTSLFRLPGLQEMMPGVRLLSLYFLVDGGMEIPFQEACLSLRASLSHKLLMSGPWPPYNFVPHPPSAG